MQFNIICVKFLLKYIKAIKLFAKNPLNPPTKMTYIVSYQC